MLSIVIGCGLWYLIFWFITNEPNLFTWHWGTKLFYLLLASTSSESISGGLTKNS
jgi:hypothetical protein